MFLCLRVYLENEFYIENLTKESMLDCIKAANYNFDIRDLNNNVIMENGFKDGRRFSIIKEFLLDFQEVFEKANLDIKCLQDKEYIVTNMSLLDQNKDLYYVCDDNYVILENLDNTTYTFFRKDGKQLDGSLDELVLLNKMLFNLFILKYEEFTEYYKYSFKPLISYTQDKKFIFIKVNINIDLNKSRILLH